LGIWGQNNQTKKKVGFTHKKKGTAVRTCDEHDDRETTIEWSLQQHHFQQGKESNGKVCWHDKTDVPNIYDIQQ
jgi:hypothetical protein